MGTPAYTVPRLSPVQFAQRMAQLFPNGWASNDGKSPGGVFFSLMQALGTDMTFELDTSLVYADDAINILTGMGNALDLASLDFFGPTGLYALPRLSNESDASFSARIEAALFPSGATRAAVTKAMASVVGAGNFRIIEPWAPGDTGVIDGGAGAGMMFLDVDNSTTPGMITDPSLGYQGFIQSILPFVHPLGPNPMPCIDNAPGTVFGGCIYLDVVGSSMFDFYNAVPIGAQTVYNAINRAKCEGTIAWVQFVPVSVDSPIIAQLRTGIPVNLGPVTTSPSLTDSLGTVTDTNLASRLNLGTAP